MTPLDRYGRPAKRLVRHCTRCGRRWTQALPIVGRRYRLCSICRGKS